MESFWLNDKKKLSCVESVESLYDILGGFPRSNSHHSDFLHPPVVFFCFCYKTSLVLSSLHAWQGHIFAFWMGIHCAFLIPDSCDPAEIPAESYGFPSQRWVSHGPPRKNNSNSVSHRLSKQSLRRIRGDASCFLGAVGKAPSCLPR